MDLGYLSGSLVGISCSEGITAKVVGNMWWLNEGLIRSTWLAKKIIFGRDMGFWF